MYYFHSVHSVHYKFGMSSGHKIDATSMPAEYQFELLSGFHVFRVNWLVHCNYFPIK
ncbi:hypothetical protein QQP08_002640 [Theobroma cacao]|nr:hypothetical protein QQP08_002640 [Theobroma cacao]